MIREFSSNLKGRWGNVGWPCIAVETEAILTW